MRISELSAVTGLSVPTVKFYIREGMLQRGHVTSATSAEYGEEHVKRIRLIVALADTAQLPLARVKQIIDVLDSEEGTDPRQATATAVAALPPYTREAEDYPYAREVLERLGFDYDPEYAATRQLDSAIRALIDAGLEWSPEHADRYAAPLLQIARDELRSMPLNDLERRVEYAVLGTIMPESIMLAMRRLAHRHVVSTELGKPRD